MVLTWQQANGRKRQRERGSESFGAITLFVEDLPASSRPYRRPPDRSSGGGLKAEFRGGRRGRPPACPDRPGSTPKPTRSPGGAPCPPCPPVRRMPVSLSPVCSPPP